MKRKSVVIFPDTIPAAQVFIPLVLVFGPVVYCQPVENDDPEDITNTLWGKMVEQSFCGLHAPAPLFENRARFLHLVRDLHQRRDDYAAQLTHVSLASIPTGSRPGTESRTSILSSLLSGHGIDSSKDEQRENLLWQARLLLKLGEQYDADQQKIAEDLDNFNISEQDLFSGIANESSSPFSLTGKLTSLVSNTDGMQRLRLKAWARLFAFGSNPLEGSRFFVSTNPDAVDRLGEEYERISGSRPSSFTTVLLPVRYPDENRYLEQLHQFLQDEATIVVTLLALLKNPSTASEEQYKMFSEEGGEWSILLDRYFPEQECGRCQLVLYDFSNVQIKQLFLDSFGHDEDSLQADLAEETPQDFVVGLLTDQ
jgi:hypothetical protein